MLKFRWDEVFVTVVFLFAFLGCEPNDENYEYYSLSGTWAVESCRVYYPSSLKDDPVSFRINPDTYPAVTLSGGFTNSKEDMFWLAEYLAGQAEVIVFAISAENNLTVDGYADAHHDGYWMMVAENNNRKSVLYQRIENYGLTGFSMGGGAAINVADDLGDDITAVVALAPFDPRTNLRNISAGCLIMVGQYDIVAPAFWNSEVAYEDLPDSIEKCLLEFRFFSHLSWMHNNWPSGNLPKKLAGDWIDFVMNGNIDQRSSFANPANEVVLNWNNLQ
jgi:hypothetical protein